MYKDKKIIIMIWKKNETIATLIVAMSFDALQKARW